MNISKLSDIEKSTVASYDAQNINSFEFDIKNAIEKKKLLHTEKGGYDTKPTTQTIIRKLMAFGVPLDIFIESLDEYIGEIIKPY